VNTCMQDTQTETAAIDVPDNQLYVRIPPLESDTGYLQVEEELLAHVGRHSGKTWLVDLSEHRSGITLMLANLLHTLGTAARRNGGDVNLVGLKATGPPAPPNRRYGPVNAV